MPDAAEHRDSWEQVVVVCTVDGCAWRTEGPLGAFAELLAAHDAHWEAEHRAVRSVS